MENKLAGKFTFASLLSFAIPNVIMMITLSMYIIVDGMFVSRLAGTTALSAVNMIYPAICFEMAIGIMIATGGSAIAARKLGEGKQREAQKILSFLIVVELVIGIVFAVAGNLFLEEIVLLLGASERQLPACLLAYGGIICCLCPCLFPADGLPDLFGYCGKTCSRLDGYCVRWYCEHCIGLYFHGAAGYGRLWRGSGYRIGILRSCCCRIGLFSEEKRESASFGQTGSGLEGSSAVMCKRFFRDGGEFSQCCNDLFVQLYLTGFLRRRRRCFNNDPAIFPISIYRPLFWLLQRDRADHQL